MRKIKVIQIGAGHDHAQMALESALSQSEVFDVVGFAVPECEEQRFPKKIKLFEKEWSVPKLSIEEALNYPELDAVLVETEEINLTKYALMAAQKGLAVHMDKPGGLDHSEFAELIGTLKEKKLAFSAGYMYRFNPAVQEALEKIDRGELGEIYSVEAHMNCEHPREKRQWLEQFPGGMMFFLGCHLIDLVYRIQGMPEEVIPLNTSTGYEGVTAQDFGMAVYRYRNGVSFIKTCDAEPGGFMRRQLVICGTKGTIEIRPLESLVSDNNGGRLDMFSTVRSVTAGNDWVRDFAVNERSKAYNRYDNMLLRFAQTVCGERENLYSYEYELELHRLILNTCGII